MKTLLSSNIGRLRIISFLEGVSFILLLFIATPMKYYLASPAATKILGPIHGALFILFILNALSVSVEENWKFTRITWKVLLASILPFGTFYIDYTILKEIQKNKDVQP